tara:strand:- start:271 stop:891 length:621 start_codon:yes stop_codon:yes gene_type:complete
MKKHTFASLGILNSEGDTLEEKISNFFKDNPYPYERFISHTKSSLNLVDKINELNPTLVIDVGCGGNHLKHRIKNLVGIDIAPYPTADINVGLREADKIFKPGCADAVLALGSINIGDDTQIYQQLNFCKKWLKPGGLFVIRVRVVDNGNKTDKKLHYDWQKKDVKYFTKKLRDLTVVSEVEEEIAMGKNGQDIKCLVWVWRRNDV